MRVYGLLLPLCMVLWAPAAFACPETSLQDMANLFAAADQPGVDLAGIGVKSDAKTGACLTDPYVLKVATMVEAKLADKSALPADRLAHTSTAWAWYRKLRSAYTSTSMSPKTVTLPAGPAQIGLSDTYAMGGALLTSLFEAELKAGKLSAYAQKLAAGAPPDECADYQYTLTAQTFIRDRGDHAGAYNVIDRAIAACEAQIAAGNITVTGMLTNRARALIASVQRNSNAADATSKLTLARADASRFLQLNKGYSNAYWRESEDRALDKLLGKAGVVSEADWFKAEYIGTDATVRAVAATLDKAWRASEDAGGINAGFQAFRSALAAVYARASQSGDPDKAKKMVAEAVRGVSDGTMRSPANTALPAVPGYLWTWIHPDVKPALQ